MMKSEWDPLKTKSDIKQRLNRLFGRFDQYSDTAVKPRAPDDPLTEHLTTTVTHNVSSLPEEQKGEPLRGRDEVEATICQQSKECSPESRDDLEQLIGQLVNVSKPLSPVRFASERETTLAAEVEPSSVASQLDEQPECSSRLSSDLDALLHQITFVEPLISPVRPSDTSFSNGYKLQRKRPSCSPRFDDAPKRMALQAVNPTPIKRDEQPPATANEPYKTVKFKLPKLVFRLLEKKRNTPSGISESDNSPRTLSSLAEDPVPLSDGHLSSSAQSAVDGAFVLRCENGKPSVDHFVNRSRELKKEGNNERDKVQQILLYFESIAFCIMTASTLNSKPEKMHSSLTDVVNFLNSSWSTFKNSKTVNTSTAASYIRNRLKTVQLMVSSCLAFHLYSIHSTRVMNTHLTLQRYEKENPFNSKRPATADGTHASSVGTTTSSPAASTPNSNRSNNSQQSLMSLPVDIYASMSQQLRTLNHLMWSHKLWSDAKTTNAPVENKALDDGLSTLCGQLKHGAELAEVAQFLIDVTAWLRKEYARLQAGGKADTTIP